MRRPRRRWRDPAPPPAGESRSPGSSPRYETPSRTRSPRRPAALHTRAHHGAQHGARPLTTAPPLSSPQVHSAILDAIPRVAQFTKQARERAASGLPTGPTKRSGPPNLIWPSNLIWTCPLACKCSPRRSSHFPTVQRSSGPPPSAVPSGYGPPPGMADGGTRQQAQAGGIHPLEQVRSPLIALDCRPAASTPSSRCVIAADSR